jgi:hypothetical protein
MPLKAWRAAADTPEMTRMFSLCSLLAAVAIGGYLFTANSGGKDAGTQAAQEIAQAEQTGAEATFHQAAIALEAHHAESGTYVGTDLRGFGGVVLARADAATYCVQAGVGPALMHQASTDGAPAPGAC